MQKNQVTWSTVVVIIGSEKRTVGSVDTSRTFEVALAEEREVEKESSPGCATRSGWDRLEPGGLKRGRKTGRWSKKVWDRVYPRKRLTSIGFSFKDNNDICCLRDWSVPSLGRVQGQHQKRRRVVGAANGVIAALERGEQQDNKLSNCLDDVRFGHHVGLRSPEMIGQGGC